MRDQREWNGTIAPYNTRQKMVISSSVTTRVRIKRLDSSVPLPQYETEGSAAFDLAAAGDVTVNPGQVALIPTGLVIEVPAGMFLGIFARSSTPLKRGLMVANGVGVVDQDYCGPNDEVKIAVVNFTAAPVCVAAGDRIAQGMLLPVNRVTWEEVDVVRSESRGGFGSTGSRIVDHGARHE
jgi:dUTP pyrophosphatase